MTDQTAPNRKAHKYPYFAEEKSADVVNARMSPDADARLAQVMAAIVRHMHAAVKEIEPTHDEWLAAIKFLTDTGHKCTDWRQEFILLSDTLGVSMLVDAINNRKPNGATENTILGPFYIPDAPHYPAGGNISLDHKGEPLVVRGKVADAQGRPIAGAKIDVWQANDDGFYDVQQKGVQPDMNLRGLFTADAEGAYWFRSAKPRYYPIPDDGPASFMSPATELSCRRRMSSPRCRPWSPPFIDRSPRQGQHSLRRRFADVFLPGRSTRRLANGWSLIRRTVCLRMR